MGQAPSVTNEPPPVVIGPADAASHGSMVVPKDVLRLIICQPCLDLRDQYALLRVSRLFHALCNADEVWRTRLLNVCEAEFPGRSTWTGYQLEPAFFGDDWRAVRAEYARPRGGIFSALPQLPLDAADAIGWRVRFRIKRVLKERFETYTGWGSMLHHHFIEGYFDKGSLLLGNLYDIAGEAPRIVYTGFLLRGKRVSLLGLSYHVTGNVAYCGPWEADEPHGRGKTYWRNGKLQYDGQFVNGAKHGIGTQYWSTGRYEGEWRNDEPNGNGVIVTGEQRYVGCVKKGKREGFGIQLYATGQTEYEGHWATDLPSGAAKHFLVNGSLEYEGDYRDGLQHGRGTQYVNGQRLYDGEWALGKWSGHGRLWRSDGRSLKYEGPFLDGQQHGAKGTLYNLDGSVKYSGPWKHGHPAGAHQDALLDEFDELRSSAFDESSVGDVSMLNASRDLLDTSQDIRTDEANSFMSP